MKRETLRVTWKNIRRREHGRTPESYCNYIIENENHKHRLKTIDGTKLFEILDNTMIFKKEGTNHEVFVDVIYDNNDNLLYVTNFRKITVEPIQTKNIIGEFKRTCSSCGKEICYRNKNSRNRANKRKTLCRSCINRKRKSHKIVT